MFFSAFIGIRVTERCERDRATIFPRVEIFLLSNRCGTEMLKASHFDLLVSRLHPIDF